MITDAITHVLTHLAQLPKKTAQMRQILLERTPMSCECPLRFDTGFIPTADYADDHIIVTRNPPLSRKAENNQESIGFGWILYRRRGES